VKQSPTILLSLAIVLAFVAAAQAAKLPKDMLGTWCVDTEYKDRDEFIRYNRDCSAIPDNNDGRIIFEQRTQHGHKYDCEAIKTTLAPDLRLGGDKYLIQYRCKGEGKTWSERASFLYDARRELLYQYPVFKENIVLTSIAPAQVAPQIPAQYRGYWCLPDNIKRTHYRCRDIRTEGDMRISARAIETAESQCKLLAITRVPGGHRVRARCIYVSADSGPDPKQSWELSERWRLLSNGRRLETND
jgi:hypothetical protein